MSLCEEKAISIGETTARYLQEKIPSEQDRVHSSNIMRRFNAILLNGNYVSIPMTINYEVVGPTYFIKFYTEDREVSLTCLSDILENRQVINVCIVPCNEYTEARGYVQVEIEKTEYSKGKRKRTNHSLKKIGLDSLPELGSTSKIDKDVMKQILEYTYGMYEDMPIITVSITSTKDDYTILCKNVPTIQYNYLCAVTKMLSAYIKTIRVNVDKCTLQYTVRFHNSPMNHITFIRDEEENTNSRKRRRY